MPEELLHDGKTRVRGDSAYAGLEEQLFRAAPGTYACTQAKGKRHRALTADDQSRNRTK